MKESILRQIIFDFSATAGREPSRNELKEINKLTYELHSDLKDKLKDEFIYLTLCKK